MGKKLRSKKGFTLIETLLAITLLGIIVVPLFITFTNATVAIRQSREKIEVNAVLRIVKENVTDAVKAAGSKLYTNGSFVILREYNDVAKKYILHSGTDFMVTDKSGVVYSDYRDYTYDVDALEDIGYDAQFINSCKYGITIKNANGEVMKNLVLQINILSEGVT